MSLTQIAVKNFLLRIISNPKKITPILKKRFNHCCYTLFFSLIVNNLVKFFSCFIEKKCIRVFHLTKIHIYTSVHFPHFQILDSPEAPRDLARNIYSYLLITSPYSSAIQRNSLRSGSLLSIKVHLALVRTDLTASIPTKEMYP